MRLRQLIDNKVILVTININAFNVRNGPCIGQHIRSEVLVRQQSSSAI